MPSEICPNTIINDGRSSLRINRPALYFHFHFYFRQLAPLRCFSLCLFTSFLYLIRLLSPFPSPFNLSSLCGALVVIVLDFLSGLSCTAYMVAFLALRVLYKVVPESLPGDDVLCRLLSRPLPSVCLFFWWNFLYLVTTAAGFVASQLIT